MKVSLLTCLLATPLLVDDGLIGMEVTAIEGNKVICKVLNNGDLGENKGVNLLAFPLLCQHWLKKTNRT